MCSRSPLRFRKAPRGAFPQLLHVRFFVDINLVELWVGGSCPPRTAVTPRCAIYFPQFLFSSHLFHSNLVIRGVCASATDVLFFLWPLAAPGAITFIYSLFLHQPCDQRCLCVPHHIGKGSLCDLPQILHSLFVSDINLLKRVVCVTAADALLVPPRPLEVFCPNPSLHFCFLASTSLTEPSATDALFVPPWRLHVNNRI